MTYSKKIALITTFVLTSVTTFAQKKINFGVGINVFQTKLHNVDRENFSGYGHSEPGFKQNDRIGLGATFLVQIPLYKRLGLETGAGIRNFRSQFRFNYIHRVSNRAINTNLNIALYYLNIPTLLTYDIPLDGKSTLNLSLGIDTRFLFWGQDNYQENIYEMILLPKARYNFLIISPQAALGYSLKLKNNNKIRFEAFAGQDLKKTVGDERGWWGFYKNLSTASYKYYGLSLKYFLTK